MNSDDKQYDSGAIRSSDAENLDYLGMPLIGLIGVARTAAEGAEKYGRFNFLFGLPAHDCVNHAMNHIVQWGMGDRSEPHLEHAAWNLMAAIQSMVLDPKLNDRHLPGPGYVVTPDIAEVLFEQDEARKVVRERIRESGESWATSTLKPVVSVLWSRQNYGDRS